MHLIYKLIGLSVVFGLVLTNPDPAAKMTDESFDDLAFDPYYQTWYNIPKTAVEKVVEESAAGIVIPKIGLVSAVIGVISKIVGLKVATIAKIIGLVVAVIKKLAPKAIFIVIGGVATFAFCKLTSFCSPAYAPVAYDYNPSQVRNFATPERLETAQQYLVRAMQQYAKQ